MDIQKLNEWFDNKKVELEMREKLLSKQFERFNRTCNFKEFTEKVIAKYGSDEYRDRYYNRGIEPPEDLVWFLYEYVQVYGRECGENEWKEYGNMFTSELYFHDGFYFNRMDGQGSIIKILKQEL